MYEYNLALRFQDVARREASRIALRFPDSSQPYERLNARANRLARLLKNEGLETGSVIAVGGVKAPDTFATMLACLKLGMPYVILDPTSPVERLRRIFTTCQPAAIVARSGVLESLGPLVEEIGARSIRNDNDWLDEALARYDEADLSETRLVVGSTPAYVMYTSGSTGLPKGAVMTHANVLNLIEWGRSTFDLTPEDTLTNVNPLYFDNSVFDFYASLFIGASLVPLDRDVVRDPKLLVETVDALGCTSWFSVPSLLIFLQTMKALQPDNMRSIHRFIFGGEGYPKAKLKKLFDLYSHRSRLFNVYGPTECTCICSCYEVTAEDFTELNELPPLGRLANNFSGLILTEGGREARPGEVGELCLLGPNVGLGYYNDPERTAASFVQNPRNPYYGDIMYKTGDLVFVDARDGKLRISGRRDNQVKHMGYRIELEDIEAALCCLDYVSEAAVLHTASSGLSRLVAVIASKTPRDEARLRADLAHLIPPYMIPTIFLFEDHLPKSPNGKIDRKALAERHAATPKEAPWQSS